MTAVPAASEAATYTIAEAAALTGLHKNTIRLRVKLGQLDAETRQGKFGEEYRIPHDALVRAGLLEAPLEGIEVSSEGLEEVPEEAGHELVSDDEEAPPPAFAAGLAELFQRHETAMFRLGYMQAELERVRALAENAESLQREGADRRSELEVLRRELEETRARAEEAAALRGQLDEARRRLEEAERTRSVLEGMERETQRLRAAVEAAQRPRSWWRRLWQRPSDSPQGEKAA